MRGWPVSKRPLTELAAVIRSKNAGPFELTLDIMFKERKAYLFLKKIDFFTRELFAETYGIDTERILKVVYFDPASAVKCTMMRLFVSGAPGDTDIYGAQQHAPLLLLKVPVED
jgi:hypothetical protein